VIFRFRYRFGPGYPKIFQEPTTLLTPEREDGLVICTKFESILIQHRILIKLKKGRVTRIMVDKVDERLANISSAQTVMEKVLYLRISPDPSILIINSV